MISCRSNPGTATRGRPGPSGSRKRPAARARRSTCRFGWRSLDLLPGRSFQIYCPCWVGKEHWPDDPDLALAGRRDRRLAGFGFRMRLIVSTSSPPWRWPAFPDRRPGRGARRRRGQRLDRFHWLPALADDGKILRRIAAAALRPRTSSHRGRIGGRQRRIGLAGTGRDHRLRFLADRALIVELHLGAGAGGFAVLQVAVEIGRRRIGRHRKK